MSEFYVGVCWPNGPHFPEDLDVFREGDFSIVKLMWYHGEMQVNAVRSIQPGALFVTRLPDIPTPPPNTDYFAYLLAQHLPVIERHYPWCRIFQFDNEPQYTWKRLPFGPWQYQYYARLYLARLRQECARRGWKVRFVSPPLSWSPGLWTLDPPGTPPEQRHNPTDFILDDWRKAFREPQENNQSFLDQFEILGVNAYWQDPTVPVPGRRLQMMDASFGLNCLAVLDDAKRSPSYRPRPLLLLEAGNSWAHRQPTPPLTECYAAMTAQYPGYVRYLRTLPLVMGVCFFLLGGTEEWLGFRVTTPTARALATWPA